MNKYIFELSKILPDKVYLQLMYYYHLHKKLNLNHPKTFNEKLQWLKIHDRKDIYTKMVDKVGAKEFVAERIGEKYVIPTIGVWNHPEDINFDELPDKFVIKCAHNSGSGMYICRDKRKMDIEKVRFDLNRGLRENYFLYTREWPYKNVPRRILAEMFLDSGSDEPVDDYKVLCFGGEPKLIELHRGRFTNHQTQDFYDLMWNKTRISQGCCANFAHSNSVASKPPLLKEMIDLSRELSKDTRHLRVDWYCINEKLYFGELTFFDGSGFDPFDNPDHDLLLGSWINID